MGYTTDFKAEHRLTSQQVETLNLLSGFESGECSAEGLAALSNPRTVASLTRRGYVNADGNLTPLGTDVLYAYL